MDPLSLVIVCALVLQPGPDGLQCKNRQPQKSLLADGPHTVKSDVRNAVSSTSKWQTEIAKASQRFSLPQAWITAVMDAESGGHTTVNGHPITSSAGAMGFMQLMPGTYEDMRQRYRLGLDSYDPQDNIFAGAAYLRAMYERYGYPHLFGAYNAGPHRFDAYLLAGKPLPSETRAYVEKILPGTSLNGEEATVAASHPTRMNPTRIGKSRVSRALFFVRSAAEGDEMYTAETAATSPQNVHSEAALFVPLTSNLHTPEK